MPEQTFEEIEQHRAEVSAPATKLEEVKLEGDAIPEHLRGKTAADLVQMTSSLQESLKVSEQARLALQNSSQALSEARQNQPASQPVPAAAPAQDEIDSMTDDTLQTLYQENPFKATSIMMEKQRRLTERNLQTRLGSLASATVSSVEQAIRTKYPEDFEILGKEITDFVNALPDKSALANPGAYDNVITYVRGQHFDKFYQAKQGKEAAKRQAELDATRAAAASTAFTGFGGSPPPVARGRNFELDATQKEICRIQGISEDEFRKHYMP